MLMSNLEVLVKIVGVDWVGVDGVVTVVGGVVPDVHEIQSSSVRFSPMRNPSSDKSLSVNRRSCRSVIVRSAQDSDTRVQGTYVAI